NCCQLMMALWLACLTTRLFALGVVILACPATTCPPLGLARANMGVKAPNPRPTWALLFSSVFTPALRGWLFRLVRYDMVCSFKRSHQKRFETGKRRRPLGSGRRWNQFYGDGRRGTGTRARARNSPRRQSAIPCV